MGTGQICSSEDHTLFASMQARQEKSVWRWLGVLSVRHYCPKKGLATAVVVMVVGGGEGRALQEAEWAGLGHWKGMAKV